MRQQGNARRAHDGAEQRSLPSRKFGLPGSRHPNERPQQDAVDDTAAEGAQEGQVGIRPCALGNERLNEPLQEALVKAADQDAA